MQKVFALTGEDTRETMNVIAVVLSDDTDRVKALTDKLAWPCRVVLAPGGLGHPLVRRLGILSADRVPNLALLRSDGTIAWTLSGTVHPQLRSEGMGELVHVISNALKTNLDLCAIKGPEQESSP
jgi:hypothetical protein